MLPFLIASTLLSMTLDEKIGQLFIVPACPERGDDHLADLKRLIEKYHIGGIILKQGTQASYRELYEKLSSPIPLLHVGDAEWGVSMRVKDAVRFPRNLTLGAIQDLSLLDQFGHQVGWECKQIGIHLKLGPVADVNTNPRNPVIGMRSFGENPYAVSERLKVVISAVQAENVGACAKHYPDHGNTSVDSHVDLPIVETMQLEPFKQAIQAHVKGIMTAHLFYRPTGEIVTFSRDIVEKKLRDELKFEGLIISDALNMGALSKHDKIAPKALQAGHDLLVYGDHRPDHVDRILRTDVPIAIAEIKQAIENKEIDEKDLDTHVARILAFKQTLPSTLPPSTPLTTQKAQQLKKLLFENAVTLVTGKPLQDGAPLILKQFGSSSNNLATLFHQHTSANDVDAKTVIAIYELTEEAKTFLKTERPAALILFTSPFKLLEIDLPPTTLIAFENDPDSEQAAIDILFGKKPSKGKLPISLK